MEDSRAACHDRCFFCVVVFGFGPFFRYVAPTVLRVSITVPARIVISRKRARRARSTRLVCNIRRGGQGFFVLIPTYIGDYRRRNKFRRHENYFVTHVTLS